MTTARLAFALLACVFLAAHASAQQTAAEVIRGRVTDDSARGVSAATVMVTRGPDRLTLPATVDSSGNYRVKFDQGTGDYLVYVSAAGFKSARRRVQRQGNETEMVADFALARDLTLLAASKTVADRPVRATNAISPFQQETGASERWTDGVNGQISPTIAGDLNAIAGTMPNITLTPGGPSILGSAAASNLTTLNGMGLSAGAIPRAARTETRVTGATFDATRGGFSGANVDVRLGPGSRQFQRRNAFVTFDPPSLQYSDASTRALGNTSGGVRGSFGADGEIIRRAMTYNVAIDLARSSSDPATLLDAQADALIRAGASPDSVARLIAVASPLGLPLSGTGVPASRLHQGITWLGRLDDTRDTLATRALTTYVGYTNDGALGFGPTAAPSASGERHERTLGAQITLGNYVGAGRRVLTESRFSLSGVKTEVTPYRDLPGATVLVRSSSLDPERDVAGVTLGGGTFLSTNDSRWTAEAGNETIWNAGGRRHRFKATLWGRADGLRQDGSSNRLGAFTFNSVDDFAANRPTSFSRTLSQPVRSGTAWNSAAAFSHQWAPTRFFSLLYGARVEADGFGDPPARNTALENALGVTTGLAPSRVHISPRVGFSYLYNRDKDNGNGSSQNQVGRFYRTATGTIRGGIGEFRDLLRPNILADASGATGLAGGTSVLSCVGSAVPVPDWSRFANDPSSIPTQCIDGSGVLAESAPSVTLIDRNYDVPRSWRTSLDWNTNYKSWLIRVGGLASYDLSQPGTVDANFGGTPRLTLATEGNRPIFVSAASIDSRSGAVSAAESRRSDQFGRVNVRTSDLRGYGGQLTFGLSPDMFKFRTRFALFTSAGYTLQATRRQYRGFDGAGFGDPRTVEWAPNGNDARHVLVFSGGFNAPKAGTITLFARAQSGLPFTPIVQGDVNGDGRSGDRAFIPDPSRETDATLAQGIRALISDGSSSARKCLLENAGLVAARNGCRGSWTQSFNIQWRPPLPQKWVARVSPNVYLQNVLAGADQLLHGSDGLRGWGSPAQPDPVLLIPRGFDVAANRYRYDVNARFADTRPGHTLFRDPFRLVIDFTVNLSTDYDLQQLRRAVEPVKGPSGWLRRSADSLASFYLSNTSSIHKALIEEADSLFLTANQVTALRRADSVYSARVRAVYVPLGQFLSEGHGGAGKAELDSVQATQKAYWKIFWSQPEVADSIVNPSQRELMPMFKSMLATPMKDREHSQWQFGRPVTFADKSRTAPPKT
ncbi:MAG TPA: carboxypeptidase-like regulatory domain-containing protein [Gemmatimonadaceae bacterium]|nr:carboxypeptidase-like regulatory domain-containing protein [Gemmatimonadaceae bacterium]